MKTSRLTLFSPILILAIGIIGGCSDDDLTGRAKDLGGGCVPIPTPGPTLFLDDAEDNDASDWLVNTYPLTTVSPGTNCTNFAFDLTGGNGTHRSGVSKPLGGIQPTSLSFWVKVEALPGPGEMYAYFRLTDASNNDAIWFYATDSGIGMLSFDTGLKYLVPTYSANTWYYVQMININWVLHTFDYYLDGTLINSNTPFYKAAVTDAQTLYLYNYTNGTTWFDEIRLYP